MNRRDFFKITAGMGVVSLLPSGSYANSIDFSKVNFSNLIIIFKLSPISIWGASQLVGNMTNFDEIESKSLVSYKTYFDSDSRLKRRRMIFGSLQVEMI